jgi:hypothetical protein
LEPEIAYDHLIQVMDAIRFAELPASELPAAADPKVTDQKTPGPRTDAQKSGDPKPTRVALFTDIAVGDAP